MMHSEEDLISRMRTENGDVKIGEDESGNILLNGEELSFENWAKFTKSNQPDVVVMKNQPSKNMIRKKREYLNFDDYKKHKQSQNEKRMENKKMRLMDQIRREMEQFENQEESSLAKIQAEDHLNDVPISEENLKDLEEGEIDSEEERRMDKMREKKRHNDNDASSSSSEESASESSVNARRRRAQLRKVNQKRRSAVNPLSAPIPQKLFDFRHQVVKILSLYQKMCLVRHLRETLEHSSFQVEMLDPKFNEDSRLDH